MVFSLCLAATHIALFSPNVVLLLLLLLLLSSDVHSFLVVSCLLTYSSCGAPPSFCLFECMFFCFFLRFGSIFLSISLPYFVSFWLSLSLFFFFILVVFALPLICTLLFTISWVHAVLCTGKISLWLQVARRPIHAMFLGDTWSAQSFANTPLYFALLGRSSSFGCISSSPNYLRPPPSVPSCLRVAQLPFCSTIYKTSSNSQIARVLCIFRIQNNLPIVLSSFRTHTHTSSMSLSLLLLS